MPHHRRVVHHRTHRTHTTHKAVVGISAPTPAPQPHITGQDIVIFGVIIAVVYFALKDTIPGIIILVILSPILWVIQKLWDGLIWIIKSLFREILKALARYKNQPAPQISWATRREINRIERERARVVAATAALNAKTAAEMAKLHATLRVSFESMIRKGKI